MSTYSVADAKNQLSELIDRALQGEGVVITRHGRPVVELRPIPEPARSVTSADLDWLAAHRVGRGRGGRCGHASDEAPRRDGAVSVYLDASVLVALLTNDPFTRRAEAFLRAQAPVLVVSDFAAAEFASAVARRFRTREIMVEEARSAFSTFDAWTARTTSRVETTASDVAVAADVLAALGFHAAHPVRIEHRHRTTHGQHAHDLRREDGCERTRLGYAIGCRLILLPIGANQSRPRPLRGPTPASHVTEGVKPPSISGGGQAGREGR